jgi:hypothetical protein
MQHDGTVEPDYAAAVENRMSLTESDGPCKDKLRSHTRDVGKLMGNVLIWHL